VGRRVADGLAFVVAPADDRAVRAQHDRADRYVTGRQGVLGLGQGQAHGRGPLVAERICSRHGTSLGHEPIGSADCFQHLSAPQGVGDLGQGVARNRSLDAHVHQFLGADAEFDQ
jgi:hypothetical protein